MNARIVEMNDSTHQKVQTLLPWFVVETLSAEERHLVQQHLGQCSQCRADLDAEQQLQRQVQASPPNSDLMPDVDRAFAKLRPRLDSKRHMSLTERLQRFWAGNAQGTRWLMGAQLLAIIGLSVTLMLAKEDSAPYRALGAGGIVNGNMVVIFKPETPERDLRRVLQHAEARIVDGPTVTDAYLLNVPENNLATALARLKSEPAVALAESLSAQNSKGRQ